MTATAKLLSIREASEWATGYIGKNVTAANIAYLIQYGLVRKIGENSGTTMVQSCELGMNAVGIDVFIYKVAS